MKQDPFRLDPAKFPKRIDLALSDKTWERLMAMSQHTGRSTSEVATEILGRRVEPPNFEEGSRS